MNLYEILKHINDFLYNTTNFSIDEDFDRLISLLIFQAIFLSFAFFKGFIQKIKLTPEKEEEEYIIKKEEIELAYEHFKIFKSLKRTEDEKYLKFLEEQRE